MQDSTQDRRQYERVGGVLVEIEDMTYGVLRRCRQMVLAPEGDSAERVIRMEALPSPCNGRGPQ
jgi:hypothetical protein